VVEDIIRLAHYYEEQVGRKPTTLKLSRLQWNEVKKDIEACLPMYEPDPQDRDKCIFMGMNVIIVEHHLCIGD
jgi:hypothetical protein